MIYHCELIRKIKIPANPYKPGSKDSSDVHVLFSCETEAASVEEACNNTWFRAWKQIRKFNKPIETIEGKRSFNVFKRDFSTYTCKCVEIDGTGQQLLQYEHIKRISDIITENININNGILEKKISYSCILLNDSSRDLLLHKFGDQIPPGWKVFCHHMTICMGELKDRELIGTTQELEVLEIGSNDKAMAVSVKSNIPSKNAKPHITLAVSQHGKPKDSNTIENWKPIEPFMLTGTIAEVPFP